MLDDKNLSLTMRELMPLVEEELKKGKDVMLPLKGFSMTPFLIHNRDSIVLTAMNSRSIRVGDMVMFKREGGSYAMHRVYKVHSDNTFDIVGDAQFVGDKNIRYDMLVAYVPKVIRNGREIDCEKGFWRTVMTGYMKLRMTHPLTAERLLKIYRILFARSLENSNE
ncbi:MAG: S24/S26 family peptidase [Eubacterium sp.]|nr:S24/S26 family peptidase [Eubacterium sp.]